MENDWATIQRWKAEYRELERQADEVQDRLEWEIRVLREGLVWIRDTILDDCVDETVFEHCEPFQEVAADTLKEAGQGPEGEKDETD